MFLQYLKLVFTKWYLYLGLLPGFLDFISVYLPEKYSFNIPVLYSWIFLGLVFLCVNYQIWNDEQRKHKSPKVIIDYDLQTFNIIYLEVKNIGNDYARNIKIIFDPNIEIGNNQKINDKNFLKNISQLSPNQNVRFFFGSFLEDKYLQKFNIKITYNNLEERQSYTEKQILDFSSFIGLSPQKKDSDEIVKELNNISKYLKMQSDNSKKANEILKTGISVRNLGLQNYSLSELQFLLKNIIENGNKEDLWLNPYIYDTKQIIKCFREKLLSKDKLDKNQKVILQHLNSIHKYQFVIGSNDKFNNTISELKKLL